ncbi:hypothetical protein K3495_g10806 [Podosphaera aphanis]|nr:hypothetical protein K3495_g10806 [Podosphaera aphanis]
MMWPNGIELRKGRGNKETEGGYEDSSIPGMEKFFDMSGKLWTPDTSEP